MNIESIIDAAWKDQEHVNSNTQGDVRVAVEEALSKLDDGTLRVAEKIADDWTVNEWLQPRTCAIPPISLRTSSLCLAS